MKSTMIKAKQILQILFLFIILLEIVTNNIRKLDDNRRSLRKLEVKDESGSSESSESGSSESSESGSSESESSDSQEQSGKKEINLCEETQPSKGIKEECFHGPEIPSGEICCYMTIKYETNDHYACTAVNRDLDSIKNKIQEIKKNYQGSKSIYIDCNSSLIKISLISFILFFII